MNLTLSIDEKTVMRARKVARAMGKSLNQLIREHLESIAADEDDSTAADEFHRLSLSSKARSGGWKFNRDEIHHR